MKKITLLAAMLWSFCAVAQINLAGSFSPDELESNLTFNLVYLDNDEPVYVSYHSNPPNGAMKFFDMDLNFIEEFSFPLEPGYSNVIVQYITRTLFDCDPDNIEFLVTYPYNPMGDADPKVQVMRQDGTVIFEEENAVTIGNLTFLSNSFKAPIMASPTGTKLFLFVTNNIMGDGGIKVFDVCGDLPTICCDAAPNGITTNGNGMQTIHRSLVMPNPTSDVVTIRLSEPNSDTGVTLQLYSETGQLVNSTAVNTGQVEIPINLGNETAGTYIYRLVGNSGVLETGKLVKQ